MDMPFPQHFAADYVTQQAAQDISGFKVDQWVDIYRPRDPNIDPPQRPLWIVYVHGGAWRDPTQTMGEILPFLQLLYRDEGFRCVDQGWVENVVGVASINYPLSAYPGSGEEGVRHPEHLTYLQTALQFFCGATMLFQLAVGVEGGFRNHAPGIGRPVALVGLAGIYDLPAFAVRGKVNREIVEGAFGPDEEVWRRMSPVAGRVDVEKDRDGKEVERRVDAPRTLRKNRLKNNASHNELASMLSTDRSATTFLKIVCVVAS
ncbi:hypothetical protein EJ06DRAFT_548474 [Trichodelitschia bisporula]|uniref:Alpha/beta-hydrolase n=1 Tax=Trichodelitschia bisporula TaxID=703511 RepID=A0A6G1HZF8_9PEZI|nr:hypothetical protein EJ06DRAFT_548474 [Trichodelitschia bisporula]